MGNTATTALLSAKQVATFKPTFKTRQSKKQKFETAGIQLPEFIKSNLSKQYEPRVNSAPMKFEKVTSIINLLKVETSFRLVPGFYAIRTSDFDSYIQNGFQRSEMFYFDNISTMLSIMTDSSYIILMCYFRISDKDAENITDRDNHMIRIKDPKNMSIFGYIKVEPKFIYNIYMYEEEQGQQGKDASTSVGSW